MHPGKVGALNANRRRMRRRLERLDGRRGGCVSEEVQAALREHVEELFGAGTRVARAALLGGGASMEAWAVDAETPRGPLPLLLRRAAGGRIYSEALAWRARGTSSAGRTPCSSP